MKKLTKFTLLFLSLISFTALAQSTPDQIKTEKESVKTELKTAIEMLDASINKINQGMPTASNASKAKLITLKNEITLKRLNIEAFLAKTDAIKLEEWPEKKKEMNGALKELEQYYELELPESR